MSIIRPKGDTAWLWLLMVPRWRRRGSKHYPHVGDEEMERRRRQMEHGTLREQNKGVVKLKEER